MPPRSTSAAVEPPSRARLIAPWAVIALIATTAGGLYLLHTNDSALGQLAEKHGNDAVSIDYLRALLQTHPENDQVRRALIDGYMQQQRYGDAEALLAVWERGSDAGKQRECQRKRLLIAEARTVSLPPGPTRDANLAQLRSLLAKLAANPATDETDWLIGKLGNYAPDQLPALYQTLAARDQGRAPLWHDKAGALAFAHSRYRDAATNYFAAQAASHSPDNRKRYFLAGVAALQSGNLLDEALSAADTHGSELLGDRDVLLTLTRLARAAGNNAAADRYARRLVRMAWLDAQAGRLALAGYNALPAPEWRSASVRRIAATPNAAFDAESFQLAFEVFVGNRKLDDALAVATAALKAVPNDNGWLKRYAQVAEWDGHPQDALAAWQKLALRADDNDAWQAILRLAPGLLDDEALLLAKEREARRRTLSTTELDQLVSQYERMARPEAGIRFLEAQFHARPDAGMLERAALLRQRSGDDAGAIVNYQTLLARFGQRVGWARTLAALRYSRGDLDGAYRALADARDVGTDADGDYWRLLGDLAWQLQHDEVARQAYQHLPGSPKWQAVDAGRLIALLPASDLTGRRAVADAAWQRFGDPVYLNQVLAIDLERGDYAAIRQRLSALSAAQRSQLEKDGDFLLLRARYHQETNQLAAAHRDFEAVLALNPELGVARIGLVWLLIQQSDANALAGLLPRLEKPAESDPALAQAVAAGWQSLGRIQKALVWQRQLLAERSGDFAWLMNYADLVEQAGSPDQAWRIRRHAWQQRPASPDGNLDALLSQLRLTLMFERTDAAERKLFAALASQAAGSRDDAAVDELAYTWLTGRDDDARARYWYWRRYARKLTDPHYLTRQSAMLRGDEAAIAQALERDGIAVQPADATLLAHVAGQKPLETSLAHVAADGAPDNDALHLALETELIMDRPNRITVQIDRLLQDTLKGTRTVVGARIALTPTLRLTMQLAETPYTYSPTGYRQNNGLLVLTLSEVGSENNADDARWSVSLLQRRAWEDNTGAAVHWADRIGGIDWLVEAALNEPTDDTVGLTLLGRQNRLSFGAGYRLRSNLSAQLRANLARYALQDGTLLGDKQELLASISWRFAGLISAELMSQTMWTSARDVVLQTPDGFAPGETITAKTLLPEHFQRTTLGLGYDIDTATLPRRSWNPYGLMTVGYQTISGVEYGGLLGVGGSVFGGDRMTLYVQRSNTDRGDASLDLGMYYQWLF
ncbi:tetratricopeptide repeat protein [Jeongeupia naejangsanensis]|uniref:Tetratricopeptide repeat protein n=1 Tax=Jeongeupia naejangsanensis TaxID=613195 RepID=A0ABS2BS32_9NEIS|nr:tetratricopeptide repeat protein [Jeongeupia naejangsanensis]MBM3117619.1 tetratricopeptide repeat protein [Jeongeupia naejangsanensis]